MKLRIAERIDGSYVIQVRTFLFWWGRATFITDEVFSTYSEAHGVARSYLWSELRKNAHRSNKIVNSWPVEL